MKKTENTKIKQIIKQHILRNKKEYIIFSIIFLIGIFLGVFFTNNMKQEQNAEVMNYFTSFIEKMKNIEKIDTGELLKSNLIKNTIFAVLLWFFGTTVIGLPVVFGLVMYRGFCIGYTISIVINVFGIVKGISFILISLLLQNIIFIPSTIAIGVSGFKLYKSITQDKRKENIKLEIIRHTLFSLLMLGFILLSTIIDTFISTNLLKSTIKYF
ncbi:MAG: stage II sporulation protein M [Clostridia bacterium]|nr:stage II sporulation protein M [Clostridia bacterium]